MKIVEIIVKEHTCFYCKCCFSLSSFLR